MQKRRKKHDERMDDYWLLTSHNLVETHNSPSTETDSFIE